VQSAPETRVLIVDDEPANLLALEAVLHGPGVTLVRANSGEQALKKAEAEDFAAILLDVRMPGMDGFEAARLMRLMPRTRLTPILFITASDDSDRHVEEAYSLGAVDFLHKPLKSFMLKAKVDFFIELDRSRREVLAAELRSSQERAQMAAEAARLHMWVWEPQADRVTWEDEGIYELFGVPRDEGPVSAARFASEFLHPADEAHFRERMGATVERGAALHLEVRFFRQKDRELRWLELTGRVQSGAGHGPLRILGTARDITDRKRVEEKLRTSDERYRALFESVDEGFCLIEMLYDPHGKPCDYLFLEANAAFERQSGLEHAVGKTIRQMAPAHEQHWFDLYGKVAATGEPVRMISEAKALGRWFDVSATRVGGAGSECVAVLFSDITQKKKAEDDLRRLAAELAESDRRKTEFLATLAHELRNPLAPLTNGLHMMRMAPEDQAMGARAREMMERQVTHMTHLVDDLLDIARVTTGKVELRKGLVTLQALVGGAVETSAHLVQAGGHDLQVRLPEEPLHLDVDPTRITQVLGNLLGNAARYTPMGGRIVLDARREGGEVVIGVTDTGIGIPQEATAAVFEMFTQVGRTGEDRAQGGLGIGLSLVRQLVELHGGSVTATSQGKDLGSTFTVRLPLANPQEEKSMAKDSAAAHEPQSPQPQADRSFRVLVVDDNTDAAESLATLLEMIGHTTKVANDGPQALQVAPEFKPEVVFLDIGMPGMNGYEVAAKLRQIAEVKSGVLVALTGWGADSDRERSRAAGFDHHLTKPAELDAVEGLLAGLRM
jgi:PAS domain S-box-containing protein